MAQIKLENITKKFGGVTAVNNFNATINDGEFISILGPSGCGKTTVLRMIAGFEKATDGRISIDERIILEAKDGKMVNFIPPEKRGVGMVFQSYAVWPHMNVFDNVGYPLKIKKLKKDVIREKVLKALEMVHLSEYVDRMPNQLSGGQQQRVALARALVSEPTLLLLDEPLSNLDAKLREAMRFEIKELQLKLGITVVYVTHDQSEAMAMSDQIIVMNKGVIQQIGTPMNIYETPVNGTVADFIGLVNFIEADVTKGKVRSEKINFETNGTFDFEGKGILAIRPENIEITTGPYDLEGILEARSYLGDSVDYRINVNGEIIRLIDSVENMVNLNKGDTVHLKIHKSMVFPCKIT